MNDVFLAGLLTNQLLGQCLLWPLVLQFVTGHAEVFGVNEQREQPCHSDAECNLAAGELCKRVYHGCLMGVCQCHPKTHKKDKHGLCRPAQLGNDKCGGDDLCPSGMRCINETCQCVQGDMTPDREFCMQPNHRFLGETCKPYIHTCIQKKGSGYTDIDVGCLKGTQKCSCLRGFKQIGTRCTHWLIGERGCRSDFHCKGGALCLEGRCKCPQGYYPSAGREKCAKPTAQVELPRGEYCDETIDENAYCAKGLLCQKCPGEGQYKCLKHHNDPSHIRMTSGSRGLTSSSYSAYISLLHITLGLSYYFRIIR